MEEMFKRKRENVEETTGEEEVFRTSKKTLRSLGRGEGGEREEIGEIMKRWREKMEDVMKELRSVKDWRDLRKMKEEVKEGIKEQGSVKKGGEENEERV